MVSAIVFLFSINLGTVYESAVAREIVGYKRQNHYLSSKEK